ncbi:MAG: nuclear transport factor 2 family protein [Caulobacterales bacterium]|nr:nuclear transport factor 2 family protein [Caulobacterales bacterium]
MTETPDIARLATLAAAQRYVDAWLAGDFPAMLSTYADDFVLHWFGDNPLAGVKCGKAAAVEALMEFTRRTLRRLVAVDNVMADAGRAVIIVRESITAGGETREVERVLVYRVADGLLAECWVYDEDQRFIDRALSV